MTVDPIWGFIVRSPSIAAARAFADELLEEHRRECVIPAQSCEARWMLRGLVQGRAK